MEQVFGGAPEVFQANARIVTSEKKTNMSLQIPPY
jgi:hypothetical protein